MQEEALETETPKKDTKADARDIESQIQTAMRSRVAHFKEQADSLTFEGVRRLLEKDLGLEPYALDVHKRFVKQCLLKSLEGVGDDKSPKISGDTGVSTQEKEGSIGEIYSKKEVKKRRTDNEDEMEDSPVLGLLKEDKSVKLETEEAEGNGKNAIPSETVIKKAVRKRYSYVKANSEKVTMAGLRRLLEEDLKLEKFSLDPYKKLISQQLEEVLRSCIVSEPANSAKKIVKKKPDAKATKKVSSEESSDASDQHVEDDEEQEDEIKPRKRSIPKGKLQNSLEPKKRKGSAEETELSAKKRIKSVKKASEDSRDAEDPGEDSEDDQSQSSPEKITKKKEVSTPVVYGKQVEHLKSVIKACGMSVPPVIYRRVKQVPDNKREAQLIKELEEILSREGLSSNPSEKEIKEVKRKKERAKELEGIDLSNIVSSSRRRSTSSFAIPPKAKEPVETKTNGGDVENSDDDNNDESNDDEEDEEDEEEENSGDDGDGSQSEELNEDEEDSD